MPTYNRRTFLPHAIRYFLRQDYPKKELIIIDDGSDSIEDLVPHRPDIHYYRLNEKVTLGAKLNMACQKAHGNIIANWDDDDWYAPRRLRYQVDALQNNETYICGINKLLYYDLHRKSAFQYVYPPEQRTWLLGSSLCYKKEFWNQNPFADINVGMDGLFVWRTTSDHVNVLSDSTFSVHMIHSSNVSPKQTTGGWWQRYSVDEIKRIMDRDWNFYSEGKVTTTPDVVASYSHKVNGHSAVRAIRNVYACLVHENEDCIIDLVRNLHYHDPSSDLILYNGGDNPRLISQDFPYHKFGAVVYPDPVKVRWGYLHDFALRCMEFAVKTFSFDTITMVDSDQLCLRQGYSQYLGAHLKDKSGIGMLSNMPDRIMHDDKTNHVAAQAFKEYELWKPFLQSFANGENKFVHWTFWPSAVFTADTSRDLVKLFKENKMLAQIIKQTKIWATEEVILPTLVRLLGYEIGLTPCSYDFVKFKKQFSLQDIDSAMRMNNAYWVHPIERKYEDHLRKYLRQKSSHYFVDTPAVAQPKTSSPMLLVNSLINRVKKIQGWLSEQETDLLIATTIKTCVDFPQQQNIIEIGSYHGKSTVAIGNVVKSLVPKGKIFAVDPHNGVVGATDQGLQKLPPSLQMFRQNIEAEDLCDVVETIRDFSYNVLWEKPVHMMFIDGLHDYPNVARDFSHFAAWIVPGAYIAFHDYADYYPGVAAFVNELLATNEYAKIESAGSLIVVQKTANKA
jgi:glycosyltransferase involved in cell wall biosynthesis/predicted O-methyltransferase YrrM